MKFSLFILILSLLIVQFGCAGSLEIPETFKGNYFEPEGKEYWICSIFPEFLVFENEFWDYEPKSIKEEEIRLIISSNSGEKQELKITKQDSLFLISSLNKVFLCNKKGNDLKIKPSNETPVWEAGTAVIKGVIYDDTTQNVHVRIEAEKYFASRESEVRIEKVDDKGRFSITIPLLTSQSVFLHYGDHRWRRIFLTPDDSLTVLINGQNGRPVHFMGRNSDVCYHMENVLDTLYQLGDFRGRDWGLQPLDFWEYIDSLSLVQDDFLRSYSEQHHCSDLFVQWCKSFIDCTRGNELGRYTFMSTKYGMGAENRLPVDHPYFAFIESIDFNDSLLLLEANTGDLVGNLNNRLHQILRQDINSEARIHQDIYALLFDYISQISDKDLDYIKSLSDSLKTYNTFSRGTLNRLVSIADPFRDDYSYRLMKGQMDRKIDYLITQEYSLVRDLLLMTVYADMKRARMLNVMTHVYNRIDTLLQYPKFTEDIHNDYSAFLALLESFQNIEFSANNSSLQGEELLLDIINSYKDTLIVLDFWYTACGPCRGDFQKMKSIKKKLYDLPIKFVYMCYSSSEKDWQNVVKEFEVSGDHYLLTASQFAYFSNLFQISSAPRYVLINSEGKIANDNFPGPTSYDQYQREISKYIGK